MNANGGLDAMARGRGEPYSSEEEKAILSGPPREPTAKLRARLIDAGFPERTPDALKTKKKQLLDARSPSPETLGLGDLAKRADDLAEDIAHFKRMLTQATQELSDVLDEMRRRLSEEENGESV